MKPAYCMVWLGSTCEEGANGHNCAHVGLGGHIHRGHIAATNADEGQDAGEGHMPHGERNGVPKSAIGRITIDHRSKCMIEATSQDVIQAAQHISTLQKAVLAAYRHEQGSCNTLRRSLFLWACSCLQG